MHAGWFGIQEVRISTVCTWGRCPEGRGGKEDGVEQNQGKWAQAGFNRCLGTPTEQMIHVKEEGLALTSCISTFLINYDSLITARVQI